MRCFLQQRRSCSNPPAVTPVKVYIKQKLQHPVRMLEFLVGAGGFEPPKLKAADLQSVPIGHSGTRPYSFVAAQRTACIYYHRSRCLSIFLAQNFKILMPDSKIFFLGFVRSFVGLFLILLVATLKIASVQPDPCPACSGTDSKSRLDFYESKRLFLELVTGVEPATH